MYLTNYVENPFRLMLDDSLDAFRGESSAHAFNPRANISEDENGYRIEVELPGVLKKDVTIELKDNLLTVSGERKKETREHKDVYSRIESRYGSFSRSWVVDDSIDGKRISAENENGILRITLPKREEVKEQQLARRIEIK